MSRKNTRSKASDSCHIFDCSNPNNWNFEPLAENQTGVCSSQELFDCYEYEYSRQVVLSGRSKQDVIFDEDDKRLVEFYKLFAQDFPKTPWLQIPPNDRGARLWALEKAFPISLPFDAVPVKELKKDNEIKDELEWSQIEYDNQEFTVLPIKIGWQHSDDEIIQSFSSFIKQFRPSPALIPRTGKAGKDERSSIKKSLKELGALRLLASMTAREAMEFTGKLRGQESSCLYASDKGWSEAKKNANKILKAWLNAGEHLPDSKTHFPSEAKYKKPPLLSRCRRWLACSCDNQVPLALARRLREREYFSRVIITTDGKVIVPFSLTKRYGDFTEEQKKAIAGKNIGLALLYHSGLTPEEIEINRQYFFGSSNR
jgi:hypothetical protein